MSSTKIYKEGAFSVRGALEDLSAHENPLWHPSRRRTQFARVEDEIIVGTGSDPKYGACGGHLIGATRQRFTKQEVDAWTNWVRGEVPEIWVSVSFKYETTPEKARAHLHHLFRGLAKNRVCKRHIYLAINGDWQPLRKRLKLEKSWHFHISIYFENKGKPIDTHAIIRWLNKGWNTKYTKLVENYYYKLHKPAVITRKPDQEQTRIDAAENKYKRTKHIYQTPEEREANLGLIRSARYDPEYRGFTYGVRGHQELEIEVICDESNTNNCRRSRCCNHRWKVKTM